MPSIVSGAPTDDLAEVLLDLAVLEDARAHRSRSPTTTSISRRTRPGCEPRGGDACAVPRELRAASRRGSRSRSRPVVRRRRATSSTPSVPRCEAACARGVEASVRRRARRRRTCYRARARSRICIRHLLGRSVGVDQDDARDPPHPLALVRGVASRAQRRCARAPRRAGASRARRGRAPSRPCCEIGPASASRTSSTTPRRIISSVRSRDPPRRAPPAGRRGRRRASGGASPPTRAGRSVGDERRAGLGQLERTHDAAAVVHVHDCSRGRIELDEPRVRCGRIARRRARSSARARAELDGRRDLEVDERGAQVQPGAARDDGRAVRR